MFVKNRSIVYLWLFAKQVSDLTRLVKLRVLQKYFVVANSLIFIDMINAINAKTQMINIKTNFANGFTACINLVFSPNTRYFTGGTEQSIYDKYHNNTRT